MFGGIVDEIVKLSVTFKFKRLSLHLNMRHRSEFSAYGIYNINIIYLFQLGSAEFKIVVDSSLP